MIREALKILEAGEAAGKLELVKTPLPKAKTYGEAEFKDNNKDMSKELPDFDVNYEKVKSEAKLGKTQRKDMPVIEIDDVRGMQKKLKAGAIDIKAPHPKDDKLNLSNNPFPAGLKGKDAELWLKDGLKPFDGDAKDDIVNVKMGKVAMGDLKPIQKQIYFDKAIQATANFGAKGTEKFLTTDSIMIVSSDNYIIDGHHRWLSGNLINPKMKSPALIIDLPIDKLLPLAIAYGDAIGNKRNEDESESIIKNILEKMNELLYGNKPKHKDDKGRPVYIDTVVKGVRIKWYTQFGDHIVSWTSESNEDAYGSVIFSPDDYVGAANQYDEILAQARKGKIKYTGVTTKYKR